MPYLCGGVFITQLMNARKQRRSVRDHYAGHGDGLSDPKTMEAFIKVMSPDFRMPAGGTFKENTSAYKNCRKNHGTHLPFGTAAPEVRAFDDDVRRSYQIVLLNMISFTDSFLAVGTSEKKDESLIKELVEIIGADEEIPDDALFFINENGLPSTKTQLLSATSVCFQAFLIGVWHYILLNRPDNRRGRDTINGWEPSYSDTLVERVYAATSVASSEEPVEAEEPEEPVVESFKESDECGNAHEGNTTQMLDHPAVFNQYGNNGVQIGSVGTLVIRHDHKDK
jgi:hypothetical protein